MGKSESPLGMVESAGRARQKRPGFLERGLLLLLLLVTAALVALGVLYADRRGECRCRPPPVPARPRPSPRPLFALAPLHLLPDPPAPVGAHPSGLRGAPRGSRAELRTQRLRDGH
ncbi:hypothetical protein P7K49_015205 [Saguinus oedipus]|uniref:Uncharacterized protein n=1 Tax=Saguinus oedipus TaxID=9490 RepID=A0ABQ9V8W8_SAGOE|nr:hypothetical protein P7K49_015205 [Saguinus oedipus]